MTDSNIVERLMKKIGAIPASGGSALDLVPATLRNKLSDQLLRRIAELAVEEIEIEMGRLTAKVEMFEKEYGKLQFLPGD